MQLQCKPKAQQLMHSAVARHPLALTRCCSLYKTQSATFVVYRDFLSVYRRHASQHPCKSSPLALLLSGQVDTPCTTYSAWQSQATVAYVSDVISN
jgi:hypothetical protein